MAKLEPIPASTCKALQCNGWTLSGKYTAVRYYQTKNGRTIKAAVDTAGGYTVYFFPNCEEIATGKEQAADAKTRICNAAMEANEIAWAVRDGATPVQAQTYATREAWRRAAA